MGMRIVINVNDIPKAQLFECRQDIEEMVEQFAEKHPDIIIPSNAVQFEGDIFGLKFSKSVF